MVDVLVIGQVPCLHFSRGRHGMQYKRESSRFKSNRKNAGVTVPALDCTYSGCYRGVPTRVLWYVTWADIEIASKLPSASRLSIRREMHGQNS